MIKVIGHINPDTDTTCSALVWAWYLSQQGIEATAYRTGELNKETAFVLEHFGVPVPELLTSLSAGDSYTLVDTNNPEELLPGWQDATLTQVIDHHKLAGGLQTSEPIPFILKPLACTATVIWDEMQDSGMVELPKWVTGLLAACIISDTLKFTSPTTTEADTKVAELLVEQAGVQVEELATAMFAAKSDLTGMSVIDILNVDSKVVTMGSKKVRVSVLETTNPSNALSMRSELESTMTSMKIDSSLDAAFFFVIDILSSSAALIVPGIDEKEIAAKAFGVDFSEETLTLPGVVSRKKQIIPKLEAVIA
jgi:manganese-dependent inorganic pyrophosphatase